jgi:hypothetical protein
MFVTINPTLVTVGRAVVGDFLHDVLADAGNR